jgi:antitoxin ParD1/3/4
MPTRNVNLTSDLDSFVAFEVKSGRYENASEVVRAALRILEHSERRREAKLAAFRAIASCDLSAIADDNILGRIREALKTVSG